MLRTLSTKFNALRLTGYTLRQTFQPYATDGDDKSKETGATAHKGEPGSGEGKGGGGGGAIRSAGGSIGKRAAGIEEQYFHKKNIEQLEKLYSDLKKSAISLRGDGDADAEKTLMGHCKELLKIIEREKKSSEAERKKVESKDNVSRKKGIAPVRSDGGSFGKYAADIRDPRFHKKNIEELETLYHELKKLSKTAVVEGNAEIKQKLSHYSKELMRIIEKEKNKPGTKK